MRKCRQVKAPSSPLSFIAIFQLESHKQERLESDEKADFLIVDNDIVRSDLRADRISVVF
jgi:hypothetical protein